MYLIQFVTLNNQPEQILVSSDDLITYLTTQELDKRKGTSITYIKLYEHESN